LYDYGARMYDPSIGRFITQDAFSEKYYESNPYHYVLNNPINIIDINGDSTYVIANENGTYSVSGGELDSGDKGIYLRNEDGSAKRIGESITSHSFFGDDDKPVLGAVIDLSSTEGQDFLDEEIIAADLGLFEYMPNATGGEVLDFKNRGIEDKADDVSVQQFRYRGSVTSDGSDRKIGSARDFGNIGAGIVAARNGLSWNVARVGFDALESKQKGKFATEGQPTQKAQRVGFTIGRKLRLQDLKNELNKLILPR